MNIKSRLREAPPLAQDESAAAISYTSAEKRTLALGGLGWTFESYDSFFALAVITGTGRGI